MSVSRLTNDQGEGAVYALNEKELSHYSRITREKKPREMWHEKGVRLERGKVLPEKLVYDHGGACQGQRVPQVGKSQSKKEIR